MDALTNKISLNKILTRAENIIGLVVSNIITGEIDVINHYQDITIGPIPATK